MLDLDTQILFFAFAGELTRRETGLFSRDTLSIWAIREQRIRRFRLVPAAT